MTRWTRSGLAQLMTDLRAALQTALTTAMRARDRPALAAYRNALSLLDNATAVPLRPEHRAGAIENSAVGLGAGDEAAQVLTDADVAALLRQEVATLLADADTLDAARPHAGDGPRHEAHLLQSLLDRESPS